MVYTAESYRKLEAAVLDSLKRIRTASEYSPVYILVGSNLLGNYLKRKLAGSLDGIFNVHLITFPDLITKIEEEVEGKSEPGLSFLGEELIVGELVKSEKFTSRLTSLAGVSGMGSSLLRTFTDLAEAGCTAGIAGELAEKMALRSSPGPDKTSPPGEKKLEVLLDLYVLFRRRIEQCGGDIHSRFRNALRLASKWNTQGSLLVYGFYDFNHLQWRLLESVCQRMETEFFVPWADQSFFHFAGDTISRLAGWGMEIKPVDDNYPNPENSTRVVILDAPGEEEEVREAVRMILDRVKDEGCGFADTGMLVPDMESYFPILREQLEKAKIPFYSAGRSDGGEGVVILSVIRLLELMKGDFSRSELVDFLVSAPLKNDYGNFNISPYSVWIRESAKSGITGAEGWIKENEQLIRRLNSMDRESAEHLKEAIRIAAGVIAEILQAGEQLKNAETLRESAALFSGMIAELFVHSPELEIVRSALERVGELDDISTSPSLEIFIHLAKSTIRGCIDKSGCSSDRGVNILSLSRARGLSYQKVIMLGMCEGRFPGRISQDPWLSDRERDKLNRMSEGRISISRRGERMMENQLLFKLSVDAASHCLICSYPRFEEESGREKIPSYFLRFLHDRSVWSAPGGTPRTRRISRFSFSENRERSLDEHEYDFATSLAYQGRGDELPGGLFFRRGVEMIRARRKQRLFTRYDGVLTSAPAVRELRKYFHRRGRRFSATALETYAGCPFRFFVERILGAEALEEPERIVVIRPVQRGLIVHQLLERIYRRFKRLHMFPLHSQQPEEVIKVAEQEGEEYLGWYQQREPVGIPVFWEIEKKRILFSIRRFLRDEMKSDSHLKPLYLEKGFGSEQGSGEVAFDTPAGRIFFRGRIDRVDAGEGGEFRVVDYKTGKLKGKDNHLGKGTHLQLPVYLIAASEILGVVPEEGTACYRRVSPSGGKDTITFSGRVWEEKSKPFREMLGVLISSMERGMFIAIPSDEGCRYCPARVCCPSGKDRIFQRKFSGDRRWDEFFRFRGIAIE